MPTLTPEYAEALLSAPEQLDTFCKQCLEQYSGGDGVAALTSQEIATLAADVKRGLGAHTFLRQPPVAPADFAVLRAWLAEELHAELVLRQQHRRKDGMEIALKPRYGRRIFPNGLFPGSPRSLLNDSLTLRVRGPSGNLVWGPGAVPRQVAVGTCLEGAAAAVGRPAWTANLQFRGTRLLAYDPLPVGVPDGAELDLVLLSMDDAVRQIYGEAPIQAGSSLPPEVVTPESLPGWIDKLASIVGGLSEELCAWAKALLLAGDFRIEGLPGIIYLEDGRSNADAYKVARELWHMAKWSYWWVDVQGSLGGVPGAVWHACSFGDNNVVEQSEGQASRKLSEVKFPPLEFWQTSPSRGWMIAPHCVACSLSEFFLRWTAESSKPVHGTQPAD